MTRQALGTVEGGAQAQTSSRTSPVRNICCNVSYKPEARGDIIEKLRDAGNSSYGHDGHF
jgi:hypothetical protein